MTKREEIQTQVGIRLIACFDLQAGAMFTKNSRLNRTHVHWMVVDCVNDRLTREVYKHLSSVNRYTKNRILEEEPRRIEE